MQCNTVARLIAISIANQNLVNFTPGIWRQHFIFLLWNVSVSRHWIKATPYVFVWDRYYFSHQSFKQTFTEIPLRSNWCVYTIGQVLRIDLRFIDWIVSSIDILLHVELSIPCNTKLRPLSKMNGEGMHAYVCFLWHTYQH